MTRHFIASKSQRPQTRRQYLSLPEPDQPVTSLPYRPRIDAEKRTLVHTLSVAYPHHALLALAHSHQPTMHSVPCHRLPAYPSHFFFTRLNAEAPTRPAAGRRSVDGTNPAKSGFSHVLFLSPPTHPLSAHASTLPLFPLLKPHNSISHMCVFST